MVKTSRRPGNKATGQCKAIAAKTCPFKHGQLHAQLVIFNRFSYRATIFRTIYRVPCHSWVIRDGLAMSALRLFYP